MTTTDPALAIDRALTDEQRAHVLAQMVRANPQWNGADVADVLAILWDADARLDLTEPLAEEHPDEWSALHGHAILALSWVMPKWTLRSTYWSAACDIVARAEETVQ